MPTRRELLALAALGTAVPAALAQVLQMPKVEVDHDPETDFTALKTFRWKDSQTPADNPKTHASITWYTERELEKKGLKKAAEGPVDLLVRYYAKGQKSLKGTPVQSQSRLPGGTGSLASGVDFQSVAEGTMILELYRAADEKLLWRAATGWSSFDANRLDAEVASSVRLLMSKYPPAAKASTP